MICTPPRSKLFPYTTLFRSAGTSRPVPASPGPTPEETRSPVSWPASPNATGQDGTGRSEEHTSELQSHSDLVCRLLLEKKNCIHLSRWGTRLRPLLATVLSC